MSAWDGDEVCRSARTDMSRATVATAEVRTTAEVRAPATGKMAAPAEMAAAAGVAAAGVAAAAVRECGRPPQRRQEQRCREGRSGAVDIHTEPPGSLVRLYIRNLTQKSLHLGYRCYRT